MATRILLVGEIDYTSKNIPSLPAVERDLTNVADMSVKCGMKLEAVKKNLSRTELLDQLRSFCRKAIRSDDLIIYYSGHGQSHGGKDYFVPTDAVLEDLSIISEYLVPVDLAGALRESSANSVTVIVDACREGLSLNRKGATWTYEKLKPSKSHVSIVYSCATGQHSRFIDDDIGSLFTISLVHTVEDRNYGRGTIDNVIAKSQIKLDEYAEKYEKPRQTIHIETQRGLRSPGIALFPDGPVEEASNNNNPKKELADGAGIPIFLANGLSVFFRSFENRFFLSVYLGFVSAILCSFWMVYFYKLFFLIGLSFGAALSILVLRLQKISRRRAYALILSSMLTWMVAYGEGFNIIAPSGQEIENSMADWMNGPTIPEQRAGTLRGLMESWAGTICGFIGAGVQTIFLLPILGRPRNILFLFVAPILGGLACSIPVEWGKESIVTWFPIFAFWQILFLLSLSGLYIADSRRLSA